MFVKFFPPSERVSEPEPEPESLGGLWKISLLCYSLIRIRFRFRFRICICIRLDRFTFGLGRVVSPVRHAIIMSGKDSLINVICNKWNINSLDDFFGALRPPNYSDSALKKLWAIANRTDVTAQQAHDLMVEAMRVRLEEERLPGRPYRHITARDIGKVAEKLVRLVLGGTLDRHGEGASC